METIHGAELVVLSFPEHNAGEYIGGLLTIATPLEKNGCVPPFTHAVAQAFAGLAL